VVWRESNRTAPSWFTNVIRPVEQIFGFAQQASFAGMADLDSLGNRDPVRNSSPFELEPNAVAQRVLVAYCNISTAGIQNWPVTASQTKSSERRDKAGVPVGIATSPRQRP